MGAEFFFPGFVIFFFGIGAVVTALLSGLFPERVALQALIWLATSGLSLALLRRWVSRVFKGRLLSPSDQDQSVGRDAVVVERIIPGVPGRVRFQGTTWKAETVEETFEPGDRVMILQTDNLTCQVTKSLDVEESDS